MHDTAQHQYTCWSTPAIALLRFAGGDTFFCSDAAVRQSDGGGEALCNVLTVGGSLMQLQQHTAHDGAS